MMKEKIFSTLFLVVMLLQYGYVSSDCPLPEMPFLGGNMAVEEGYHIINGTMAEESTTLTFTCSEGYKLFGVEQIQCQENEWSSNKPFCFENKCPRPPIVENAYIVISPDDFGVGSIAEYTCYTEYELANSSLLKCSLNTENRTTFWEGETPVCKKKVKCEDPGSSPNGERAGDCCFSNDILHFSCKDGYELVGKPEIICLESGEWSSPRPLCRQKVECEDPGSSPNGEREGNCCFFNDALHFSCKDGYQLVGKPEIRCLQTGEWSSPRPLCRPLYSDYCEFPDSIPNGQLVGDKEGDYFVPGEKAHIWCEPGYKSQENDDVECGERGIWAKKFGICKDNRCPNPGTLENRMKSSSNYSVGSRIRFACSSGYELFGADEIVCLANKQWMGRLTRCNQPDCPLPELNSLDVSITVEEVFSVENRTMDEELDILPLPCSDGYTLFGDEKIPCLQNEWSSKKSFCFENKCPRPPIVENGKFVIRPDDLDDIVVGSIAEYSCYAEYELANPNSSLLKCRLNKENRKTFWEGETPVCKKKIECKDPGSSPNGEREGNCCSLNDTLHFSCKDGYQLVGKPKIICLETEKWSSPRPLCRPLYSDYCEFPKSIGNGKLVGDKEGDYFVPGEKAHIWCRAGYKSEENDEVECGEGGIWTKKFGVCKEVLCSPPPPVEHGKILEFSTNITKFPFEIEITYVCDEGYRIVVGGSWRMCTKEGIWSGMDTVCEVIRCPDPGTPENGIKSSSNYSVGSKIRFRCNSGYELLGSEEIVCQANGQWTGQLTRCNRPGNYCPDPGTPMMGSRNKSKFRKGERVRFSCDPRTFLLGSQIRKCLSDRTWSGTPTKCMELYDFDNAENGKERLLAEMAAIKEQQGEKGRIMLYFAFDISGSIPISNFNKSLDFAKAIVREVGVSANGTGVGAVTFANEARGIFLPIQYETVQNVLLALDKIKYTGGGTSTSSALRFIRTEYIPLVQKYLKGVEIKSVIFVLTDGRANTGGDPKIEAEILKSQGVEIFCVGITGNSMKKALYEMASQFTYGEDTKPNVFTLQDYKTLQDTRLNS